MNSLYIGNQTEVKEEVKEKCRAYFQKASDNGTVLSYWNHNKNEPDSIPLIDCGIDLFIKLKSNRELNYYADFTVRSLEVCAQWSSGLVKGGWGDFEVNLPEEDIKEFQDYLNKLFTNPANYIKG